MSLHQGVWTCFSSSMIFNLINVHGPETYIKSKYIIKCFGKEEWIWMYASGQSKPILLDWNIATFKYLYQQYSRNHGNIHPPYGGTVWNQCVSTCVSFQCNHCICGLLYSQSSLESWRLKKAPRKRSHLLTSHEWDGPGIPATDVILEQYLVGHLQLLFCRLQLVTILQHFEVGCS